MQKHRIAIGEFPIDSFPCRKRPPDDTIDLEGYLDGLESASEVTAYGPPVNNACKKLASKASNEIRISKAAHRMYPTSKGGKAKFLWFEGGYSITFPPDYYVLGGNSYRRPRKNK